MEVIAGAAGWQCQMLQKEVPAIKRAAIARLIHSIISPE
jgi:hypothetical protein